MVNNNSVAKVKIEKEARAIATAARQAHNKSKSPNSSRKRSN